MVTYLCNLIHRPHMLQFFLCVLSKFQEGMNKVYEYSMRSTPCLAQTCHQKMNYTLIYILIKLLGTCFSKGDFSSHFHTASVFVLLFLYTFLFRNFSVCHLSLMIAVSALSVEDKVSRSLKLFNVPKAQLNRDMILLDPSWKFVKVVFALNWRNLSD